MFLRAARFEKARPNDTPGPNAYDPTEQEAHYKRGAMFERDARFRTMSRGADYDDGAEHDAAVATTSKVKLDARIPVLEREKAKLEARVKTLQQRVEDDEARTTTLEREKKQVQTDLRLLTQKWERSQAQQAAHTKSQSARTEAVQQLKEQVQQLEAKLATQKLHTDKINAQFARSEDEKWTANETLSGLRKKLREQEGESHRLRALVASLTSQIEQSELERMASAEEAEDDRTRLSELQRRLQESSNEHADEIDCFRRSNAMLVDERDELNEEVYALQRQRDALEAASLQLASEKNALQDALSQRVMDSRIKDVRIRRLLSVIGRLETEKEGLRASLSEQGQITIPWSESEEEERTAQWPQRHPGSGKDLHQSEIEESLSQWIDEETEVRAQRATLRRQYDDIRAMEVHMTAEWQNNVIERLHGEIRNANAQHRALLDERESQNDLRQALEKARQEVLTVEEQYEAGVLEVMQAHEKVEQMQAQMNRQKADLHNATSRLQKMEGAQEKLKHSKLREDALLQERQGLLEDLSRSSNYESAYYGIRAEAQKLLTRLSAREVQAQELASLNAALASHSNPHQKINYLERIRRQLDDTRLQFREMEMERNSLHRLCGELRAQLDVFRNVNGAGSRADATHVPSMLDEREAARRAWQSRPKTRFTRVTRVRESSGTTSNDNTLLMVTHKPLRERGSRSALSDRSNDSGIASNGAPYADDSGEVSGWSGIDGESGLEASFTREMGLVESPPKRRHLRARRSDTALRDRASPVATLPSFDALAWELDKDHLVPPSDPTYGRSSSTSSSSSSPIRPALLLDGELSLHDLTG